MLHCSVPPVICLRAHLISQIGLNFHNLWHSVTNAKTNRNNKVLLHCLHSEEEENNKETNIGAS